MTDAYKNIDKEIQSQSEQAVALLQKYCLKISTAESCTGGMLSSTITSVSGASQVFELGVVSYSDRIKNQVLSVPADTLEKHGAISPQAAVYLAKNVQELANADIGVSITGNAGPTASENKAVGLVYIAIADKETYSVKALNLSSYLSREEIRKHSVLSALNIVNDYLNNQLADMKQLADFE